MIIKKRGSEEEYEEFYDPIEINWAEYLVCARKMGMSEEEFWNSCPIFFNEQLDVFEKMNERKGG